MWTDDRNAYRKMFFDVWDKHQKKLILEPLEAQVLDVILIHPEFHDMLHHRQTFMTQEFALEENPFFHMSLHMAVREQLRLDRPVGVRAAYQALLPDHEHKIDAEHFMMSMLEKLMSDSQKIGSPPDEKEYLKLLTKIR